MLLKRQRGMSIMMGLFVLIVVAFIGLVGLKLFPVYTESMKIDHALQGLIDDPSLSSQTPKDMAFSLVRRLDIDGVYLIKESNWKDYMTITKSKGKVEITVKWRKEIPLFANLSLVADFDKDVLN